MCGASGGQKEVAGESLAFLKAMNTQATQNFAGFNDIIGSLTSKWKPILDAGINQTGFSDAERTAKMTAATEHVAGNFTRAREATANAIAASGGGNEELPSGAAAQLTANAENASAGESSQLENEITQEDYATGRQNYLAASNALSGEASLLDPSRIAGAVNDSSKVASDEQNAIVQADQAWMAPVFGAIGGAGSAAIAKKW